MSVFQYYKDKAGEWRWRLRANNNEIIATSGEGYKNKRDCLHGVDLIRTLSPDAEVRIHSSDNEYIVCSKEEDVLQQATDELVEPRVEAFAPHREPEKHRSWRWLWAIPLVLLLLMLIFLFRASDKETRVLQDNAELAQQRSEYPATEQTPAAVPSPTIKSEITDVTPEDTGAIPATSHMIEPGDTLWRLAQTYYQDSYLWPLIFKENLSKISHPDILSPGTTLDVPGFEGSSSNFTETDSSKIAVAFIQAYLAYKNHDNTEARNYLRVANLFDSDAVSEVEGQVNVSDLQYATK
jgi:uncharacterized protein YegP (UPF0339 family)